MGSSPHTRGAPPRRLDVHVRQRIIPAYAGSTSDSSATQGSVRDHPRIRGEHCRYWRFLPFSPGSSPHTRGARPIRATPRRRARIIPAYAGSTVRDVPPANAVTDHPRIRGEHDRGYLRPGVPEGSSPHTRGALSVATTQLARQRIIPAYAGSTEVQLAGEDQPEGSSPHTRGARRHHPDRTGALADHPRIRGEHPDNERHHPKGNWIIPAYAGSTPTPTWNRKASCGSSPHTRGARPGKRPRRLRRGIIPAYAGSTFNSVVASSSPADHPRIRGEHPVGA